MFPVSVAKLYGIAFYRTTLVDYFSKLFVSNIAVHLQWRVLLNVVNYCCKALHLNPLMPGGNKKVAHT